MIAKTDWKHCEKENNNKKKTIDISTNQPALL